MKGYSENYWAKRAGQYNKTNWVKNEDFINSFLNMLPRTNFEYVEKELIIMDERIEIK
jgi:hypothetical protein